MFDSRTASDGVLRACVVVVVATRAKRVASRRRMVCGAEVVIPLLFGARTFCSEQCCRRCPEQILLFKDTCGDLPFVVGEDNCYRA